MPPFAGHFVWHELLTTDAADAQRFYCNVVGWRAEDSNVPGVQYTRLMVGNAPAAGLMALPPEACEAGAKPGWGAYVGVESVDDMAARVTQAGGTILHGPMDIPTVGRFAKAADPQGAIFALFQPASAMEGEPPPMGTPGTAGWHELHAVEWPAAFAFYSELFGWQKGDAVDMGPMGTYQLFTTGGAPVGGMMSKMAPEMPTSWLYYFNVADINAAAARVTAEGGKITNGPHPVPGGSQILHCLDPQGIVFALVEPAA